MTPAALARRNRVRVITAFAAVYLAWGATYLFIKYAVQAIPPFLMGASRHLLAGALLYAAARARGASGPSTAEVRAAAAAGLLMLGVGNGAVLWAARIVPSGIVALIVSAVPLWIVLADWAGPTGVRPRSTELLGVFVGLAGIVVLIGPKVVVGQGNVDAIGTLVLVVGSVSWAVGSIATRRSPRPSSALVSVALQMMAAGAAFGVVALAFGEMRGFTLAAIPARAVLSWLYLIFFGSLVGYTAYIYLLGAVSPAKASTYAYVNPVIAVFLGWAFAGESVGLRTLVAAAIILIGVAIITTVEQRATAGEP